MAKIDDMLAKYIAEAESRLGDRLWPNFTIQPVSIIGVGPDDHAETKIDKIAKTISVIVTGHVHESEPHAIYQLAHEAVHCVIGSGRRDTLYLEEGLALTFSLNCSDLAASFREACRKDLHEVFKPPLQAFHGNKLRDDRIRKFRRKHPDLDTVQPEDLKRVLKIEEEQAKALCKRMSFDRPKGI